MILPDRIGGLIKRLEAGESVTQQDVDRLATLQLLDIAKAGEDFARETIQRDADRTEAMRKSLEELWQQM